MMSQSPQSRKAQLHDPGGMLEAIVNVLDLGQRLGNIEGRVGLLIRVIVASTALILGAFGYIYIHTTDRIAEVEGEISNLSTSIAVMNEGIHGEFRRRFRRQ